MKKKIIPSILLTSIFLFIISLLSTSTVFGASGSDGDVTGGSCAPAGKTGIYWDTCHGGVWRRYDTGGNDSIIIPSVGRYTEGGTISGCGKYKYYYRLAMVKYTIGSGNNDYSGDQVGLLPVFHFTKSGGDASVAFTNYGVKDGKGTVTQPDWATAKKFFEAAKAAGQTSTTWNNTSWFCYDPSFENVTLTAKAVTTSGTAIKNSSNVQYKWSNSGAPNTSHSVTVSNLDNYVFKGFKNNISSSFLSTGVSGRTYSKNISQDTEVLAVYKPKVTLTLQAVRIDDSDMTHRTWNSTHDKTSTVEKDTEASVTADNIDGYTLKYWGTTSNAKWKNATGRTYKETISSNTTRLAVYERNYFQGYVKVMDGSATNNLNASGWGKNETDAGTAEIECANDGCNVVFRLYLRTYSGSGNTTYAAEKQKNGGSWAIQTVSPASPSAPNHKDSTDGNTRILNKTETLKPGETVCYRLTFKPYNNDDETVTKKVCAKAKASTFEGKTSVSGTSGGTNSTNWQKTDNSQIATISNCSPTSGCQVSFTHQMKRTSGIGSSSWTVARTSNLTSKVSSTTVGSGTFNPSSNNTGNTVQTDNNLTLYPGMVVCETLTFYPNNTSSTTASTKVCVHALGNAQPSDTALLDIKVKNNSVNKYSTYTNAVYAKPGDSLTYQTTYNPILQYTYNLKPQKMRIDSGATTYPTSSVNTSSGLGSLFNANHGSSLKNWNNAFSIQRTTNSNWSSASLIEAGVNGYTYTAGSTDTRTKDNNVSVATSYVGKSIDERAITNLNDTTKTTPSQVTFTEVSGNNTANVVTTQVSSIAHAYVPYNFTNTTAVTTNTDTPFYAGEQQTVSFTITTNPRCNNYTTNDTCTGSSDTHKYATKVDGAKWKLAVKVGSGAWQYTDPDTHSSSDTGTLNSGNTSTGSTATKNLSIIVPDVAAGTQICVKSMVYPANSGAATNWSDKEGSHTWAESSQQCFTVAKRPNLQVLGGNVYSNGQIVTNTSVKQHLSGYTTHVLDARDSNNNNYVFGSWGELGVISGGPITGFASGATLGYSLGSLEAKAQTNYCNRIPLTIANAKNNDGSCLGNTVGALGNSSSNNNITDSKNDLFAKYVNTEDAPNDLSVAGENNIDSLKVYYAKNTVTITGNLYYKNSGHTTLENLPKVLIFSNGEIKINCDVTHIDGVLVANKVTTCADSDDINAAKNSTQLTVNGAIITSNLVANRTYGAATGVNSIVPAEIINFDPSLYRWESGNINAETTTTENANLITTYQKELAPRH